MNLDSLNKWLTLLANIGVIAGIAFLAIEIGQNSQMMKAQTRSDIAQSLTDILLSRAHSPYLSEILGIDPEETELIAESRRTVLYLAQLRTWENIHYQYRNGMYEESEFIKEKLAWGLAINNLPDFKGMYCETKAVFSSELTNELDALLESPCIQ